MTRGRRTLTVPDSVVQAICAASVAAQPHETGGILLGWRATAEVVVRDMVEVPDTKAGHAHYERDYGRTESRLDAYLGECDDPAVGYVGEWHTHPRPSGPSPLDRSTMFGIAAATADAIGLLVVAHDAGRRTSSAFGLVVRRGDPTSAWRRPMTITRIINGAADGQA